MRRGKRGGGSGGGYGGGGVIITQRCRRREKAAGPSEGKISLPWRVVSWWWAVLLCSLSLFVPGIYLSPLSLDSSWIKSRHSFIAEEGMEGMEGDMTV